MLPDATSHQRYADRETPAEKLERQIRCWSREADKHRREAANYRRMVRKAVKELKALDAPRTAPPKGDHDGN
jgi:hypothetical protein